MPLEPTFISPKDTLATVTNYLARHDIPLEVVNQELKAHPGIVARLLSLISTAGINLHDLLVRVVEFDALSFGHALQLQFTTRFLVNPEQLKAVFTPCVVAWLNRQASEDVHELIDTLLASLTPEQDAALRTSVQRALLTLSYSAVTDGLRLPKLIPFQTPHAFDFLELGRNLQAYLALPNRAGLDQCTELVRQAQDYLQGLLDKQRDEGVSLQLGYHIHKLDASLQRLNWLLHLPADPKPLYTFVLGQATHSPSIGSIVQKHTRLLVDHIVNYTSFLGQHYILDKRESYYQLFRAALGGGIITAVTCLLKLGVGRLHLPPLVEGFLIGLTYALSFVLIYLLHFTLATKQPATTSAALILTLKNSPLSNSAPLHTYLRICRSQMLSVCGNLLAVVPVTVFLVLSLRLLGFPLSPDYGREILEQHHPLSSATLLYAAVTGVVLYVCSLAGGYVHNLVSLYRLSERASTPTLRFLTKNAGGLSTSVVLGFALGLVPVLEYLTGLPLNVRHVTLSAGTIAAGFGALDTFAPSQTLPYAGSVFAIGVLNIGVSFSLGVGLALALHNISLARVTKFFQTAVWFLIRRPHLLFAPWSARKDSKLRPVRDVVCHSTKVSASADLHV